MKTTENITVTDGRLSRALSTKVIPIVMPKVTKQVNKAVKDSKFKIGVMTKFYPYLDKCQVEINGELIICRILHRFVGGLTDYYTPLGDEDFCDNLKEPCVIPWASLECVVLDVDNGDDEQIMVGYLNSEEIGLNPAKPGNMKLVSRVPTNQFWIKFGWDGLDLRLNDTPTTNTGETDEEMSEVDYVNVNEVYTKSEIDKIIEDLRKEIHGEDDTDELEG